MALKLIKNKDNVLQCLFCKSAELDEINLGPMYSYEDVVTHYFCMLFSAGLVQKGSTDKEGILGFLPIDIWKEVRRGNRLKCTFCNQIGASIGCCKKSCKTMCHFRCGMDHGVQFQFLKNFTTYCKNHYIPQSITIPEEERVCPICISLIENDENPVMPSCCKGAVFHKECVKRMALNAGYFFKCPMCNATKKFITEMRLYGVFVPEQDASWEREPHAFQDHYYQYSTCDSDNCVCPKGKDFNAETGDFEIARCSICGAAALHVKCGKLKNVEDWNCDACSTVLKKAGLTANSAPCSSSSSTSSGQQNNRGATSRQMLPEVLNIAKLKIIKPARRYFPYPREELRKFQAKGVEVLPDWRGLELRVNMVDWIGSYVHGIGSVKDSKQFNINNSPIKTDQSSLDHSPILPQNTRVISTTISTTEEDIHQISKEQVIPTAGQKCVINKSKSSKKRKKGGGWKRGVSSKRKDKNKIKSVSTSETQEEQGPAETQVRDSTIEETMSSIVDPQLKQETTSICQDNNDDGKDKNNTLNNKTIDDNKDSQKVSAVIAASASAFASASSSFSSPFPVKRRKVLELGHNMYALGVARDIFVQSNVIVGDPPNDVNDPDIDLTSLSPLQEESSCTKLETRCDTDTDHLQSEKEDDHAIGEFSSVNNHRIRVLWEHSYAKIY